MPIAHRSVATTENSALLCRRRFGCPTCLDAHERVWLVIERTARSGDAVLNGRPLGHITAATFAEFDITGLLRERNELCLRFDAALPSKGYGQSAIAGSADDLLFEDVRLEIRG